MDKSDILTNLVLTPTIMKYIKSNELAKLSVQFKFFLCIYYILAKAKMIQYRKLEQRPNIANE